MMMLADTTMPELLNINSILLVLQSMARDRMFPERPTDAMALSGMRLEDFAAANWADLGISTDSCKALQHDLGRMFSTTVITKSDPDTKTPGALAQNILTGWQALKRHIVYQSSGSSGTPKLLTHSYEAVLQEVDCLAGLFPQVRHIIGVTPQHHCYGFIFGVLMHTRLGVPYTTLPALPTIIRHSLSSGKILQETDGQILLVGYPDLWLRIQEAHFAPPRNLICLSAGSPWPPESMRQLYAAGFRRLLEIYGSSENGAVGYRWGSENPGDFTLLDYWSKKLPDAADEGSQTQLFRRLPDGQLLSCPLQDELIWSSDCHFRPLKRRDGAVQVSGINVYPERSAAVIAAHPQVQACRVRLMRPEEGCRLKAFIVPQQDAPLDVLRRELKMLCKHKLSSPARPTRFTFGPAVPKNNFGKETDWN